MKRIFELTRFWSVPMSIAPFLIALCLVPKLFLFSKYFILTAILVFFAIVLIHLSVNLYDDYLDYKYQDYDFNTPDKAKLLINNTFSLKSVEKILVCSFGLAILIGIFFIWLRGVDILFFMLTAGILCAFYPVSSKYGLSEIIVGVIFGPLLVNGAYYAMTGLYSSVVFNFSISSGILTSILLITHSLMDYEYDIKVQKQTIPVILKNKNLTINLISILILCAYIITGYTSLKYGLGKAVLFPIILSVPVAIKLLLSLYDYINIKDVPFVQKWYFGPMENFDKIQKTNMAYFMYRIYLARNLCIIYNITLAVACLFLFKPFWMQLFLF